MIDIVNEADLLICKLTNGCAKELTTLCDHTIVASGKTEVAEDIRGAWDNLLDALKACKRVF